MRHRVAGGRRKDISTSVCQRASCMSGRWNARLEEERGKGTRRPNVDEHGGERGVVSNSPGRRSRGANWPGSAQLLYSSRSPAPARGVLCITDRVRPFFFHNICKKRHNEKFDEVEQGGELIKRTINAGNPKGKTHLCLQGDLTVSFVESRSVWCNAYKAETFT